MPHISSHRSNIYRFYFIALVFSDINTRSSAYRRNFIFPSFPPLSIGTPYPSLLRSDASELINILNKVGDNGQPYLTPLLYGNGGDSPKAVDTVHLLSLYRLFIDSSIAPVIP